MRLFRILTRSQILIELNSYITYLINYILIYIEIIKLSWNIYLLVNRKALYTKFQ